MAQASNDLSTAIQQMLEAVDQNDDLKRGLRMATTAAAVCDVAAQAGLSIQPAAASPARGDGPATPATHFWSKTGENDQIDNSLNVLLILWKP